MYTNINNNLGQEAIRFWLEKHPELIPRNISKDFILEGLKIVLECNVFTFDNRTYLQIRGTAMGTKCTQVYVTLVMAYVELKLYQTIQKKYGTDFGTQFQDEWGRYLDDYFISWDTNMSPINNFHQILNNLHPSIKFTMEYNKNEMNFLDIKMIVKGENIITDIFYKATDTLNYVPFKSAHPKHTLLNIPCNLARRLCTIVDERMTLEERLSKLEQVLKHLGYPQHIIKNGIEKAKRIPQETLRRPK